MNDAKDSSDATTHKIKDKSIKKIAEAIETSVCDRDNCVICIEQGWLDKFNDKKDEICFDIDTEIKVDVMNAEDAKKSKKDEEDDVSGILKSEYDNSKKSSQLEANEKVETNANDETVALDLDPTLIDVIEWEKFVEVYVGNKSNYKRLLNLVQNQRNKVIPFVGSGLSTFVGYPDWTSTLRMLASDLPPDLVRQVDECLSKNDIYGAGDVLCSAMNSASIRAGIEEIFDETKAAKISVHTMREQAVYQIPEVFKNSKFCITTNCDSVIERAYGLHGQTCSPFEPSYKNKMASAKRGVEHILVKLHGGVNATNKFFVLSKEQFNEHYFSETSPIATYIDDALREFGVVFIGASLRADFPVKNMKNMKSIYGMPNSNYAILPVISSQETSQRVIELDGIVAPIFYELPANETQKHNFVSILMKWLAVGWNPDEPETKARIERVKRSLSYRCEINGREAVFYRSSEKWELLIDFLNSSRPFLRHEIVGDLESGRSRWLLELSKFANAENWETYCYSADDLSKSFITKFSSQKNILIVFDDLDLCKNLDDQKSLVITIKNLVKLFIDGENKLRIVFSYETKGTRWWSEFDSDNQFGGGNIAPQVVRIEWSLDDVEKFTRCYVNRFFPDASETVIVELCRTLLGKEMHSSLFWMILYIEMHFLDGDFDEALIKLSQFLSNSNKKIYIANTDSYIEEHRKALYHIHQQGKKFAPIITSRNTTKDNHYLPQDSTFEKEM
ncbi:hypothetical protein FACS1894188_05390 [Clostridia bacterium]|nr:hypothetical protein FACS1894188_05390 [Clostridia bacterium]